MIRTIYKAFLNYEKEERWINIMSSKGWALIGVGLGKYVFAQSRPNEYTYKMELLNDRPSHIESEEYLNFLESTGVEVVASYIRWVYYRKKTSEGAFEIFSDKQSKAKHYERIFLMYFIIMVADIAFGLGNILVSKNTTNAFFSIIVGVIMLLIGILLAFTMVLPVYKKIRSLKREREIQE